jgi:hypothetical protein
MLPHNPGGTTAIQKSKLPEASLHKREWIVKFYRISKLLSSVSPGSIKEKCMYCPSVCFSRVFPRNQKTSAVKKSKFSKKRLERIGGYRLIIRCIFPTNFGFSGRFNNRILVAAMLFFLLPSISLAAQATLEWEPAYPSPDGYYVFQRIEGEQFNYNDPVWPIDGKDHTETTYTVDGLTEGVTYYFVVRAYIGSISVDSNVVSHLVPISQPTSHTISASSSANGKINPSAGDISVNHGGSQTFYFIPDSGYEISVVAVDGQSIGTPASYTFSNVVQHHSIAVSYAEIPEQNPSPLNEEKIWLEAEEGDIYSPIIIADDPNAWEGGYIHAPAGIVPLVESPGDTTGRSEYTFDVPSAGDYVIWGRVNAIYENRDSFHVAMDEGSFLTWHVRQTATDSWVWDVVSERHVDDVRDETSEPFVYHLDAGSHKLTIATREAGTKIDRILITNLIGYIPTDMDEPSSISGISSDISKENWRLVSVDSEERIGEDGAAVNAFDDDPATIWHTQWADASPSHPHELVIDLGATYQLDGFSMLPRQDGSINGRIVSYEFYVGDHPDQWSSPVASGRFSDNATEKTVAFSSTTGRYIRLVALSDSSGRPYTSMAEISVKGQ